MAELLVRRKGYTAIRDVLPGPGVRRKRVVVGPATFRIKDRGTRGKGFQIDVDIKEGELEEHGYSLKKGVRSRRRALAADVRERSYRKTLGAVRILEEFNKRVNRRLARRATVDRKWLVKTFGGPGSFGPRD